MRTAALWIGGLRWSHRASDHLAVQPQWPALARKWIRRIKILPLPIKLWDNWWGAPVEQSASRLTCVIHSWCQPLLARLQRTANLTGSLKLDPIMNYLQCFCFLWQDIFEPLALFLLCSSPTSLTQLSLPWSVCDPERVSHHIYFPSLEKRKHCLHLYTYHGCVTFDF